MLLAALVVGIAALVVVSLATSPEPAGDVAAFYARLETSSDADGAPAGTAQGSQPLLLVNILRPLRLSGGRGWSAYREDLWGFGVGWAIVVTLVVATAIFFAS